MSRSRFDIMTCDITLKKARRGSLRSCRAAIRRVFPLSILLIFICHKMSLRHQPLLEGLSFVTFIFHLLSFVTPFAGAQL